MFAVMGFVVTFSGAHGYLEMPHDAYKTGHTFKSLVLP